MKINITDNFNLPGMAGMGPVAWDRDAHRMSMHPPLPEHIDHVEEMMQKHQHHDVHRRDPDTDSNSELVSMEIPMDCLKPLLNGKDYFYLPENQPADPSNG